MAVIDCGCDIIRNGAKYSELKPIGAQLIKMDSAAEIKASLSATYQRNDNTDFLNDLLSPWIMIDGTKYYIGEYIAATVESEKTDYVETMKVEAYDRCLAVKQTTTETMIYFEKGSSYMQIINELLLSAGITKTLIEETSETLQTDREDWEIGTSYLDIINQLLSEINYNELWFDNNGYAQIERYRSPTAERIKHTYTDGVDSIIKLDSSSSFDSYQAYNVFRVVVDNPDLDVPIIATAENDEPDNPLSTIRRGRRIAMPTIQLDNISSQRELQNYINNVKAKHMMTTQTVKFTTAINPNHGAFDTLALNHSNDICGIYEESSWEISLNWDGEMTHTAKRGMFL